MLPVALTAKAIQLCAAGLGSAATPPPPTFTITIHAGATLAREPVNEADAEATVRADAAYSQALKDATGSSAATAALGENTLAVTQTRMQGLDQLRSQLDNAKDPKDVMDLQARVAVEQAQLQNDMLKMQALQMAQAGEGNLAITSAEVAAARNAAAFYDANTIRK